LEADHREDHVVAGEAPDDEDHGRPQGPAGRPEDGAAGVHEPEGVEDRVQRPHRWGVQSVEEQRRGGEAERRRHEDRRPQEAVPPPARLDEEREEERDRHEDDGGEDGVLQGEAHRVTEQRVAEHLAEVRRPVRLPVAAQQAPLRARHEHDEADGHEEEGHDQDDGRGDEHPPLQGVAPLSARPSRPPRAGDRVVGDTLCCGGYLGDHPASWASSDRSGRKGGPAAPTSWRGGRTVAYWARIALIASLWLSIWDSSPHTASWMSSCHGLPAALKASLKLRATGAWPSAIVALAMCVRGSASA